MNYTCHIKVGKTQGEKKTANENEKNKMTNLSPNITSNYVKGKQAKYTN